MRVEVRRCAREPNPEGGAGGGVASRISSGGGIETRPVLRDGCFVTVSVTSCNSSCSLIVHAMHPRERHVARSGNWLSRRTTHTRGRSCKYKAASRAVYEPWELGEGHGLCGVLLWCLLAGYFGLAGCVVRRLPPSFPSSGAWKCYRACTVQVATRNMAKGISNASYVLVATGALKFEHEGMR